MLQPSKTTGHLPAARRVEHAQPEAAHFGRVERLLLPERVVIKRVGLHAAIVLPRGSSGRRLLRRRCLRLVLWRLPESTVLRRVHLLLRALLHTDGARAGRDGEASSERDEERDEEEAEHFKWVVGE